MNTILFSKGFIFFQFKKSSFVRFLCIFLIETASCLNFAYAQNSNVTISASPTSNGCWKHILGPPNIYTFTPTGDNANVNTADIIAIFSGSNLATTGINGCEAMFNPYGLPGSVLIKTERIKGKQPGNVIITSPIIASNYVPTDFNITAGANIAINSSVNLSGLNGSPGYNGVNIILTAGKNGAVKISGPITNSGGDGAKDDDAGGNAGQLTVNGPDGISLNADLTAMGGKASGKGVNGKPGTFTFNDGASKVTTSGGNNDGHTGGIINGGKVSITGSGKFKTAHINK